MIIFGDYLLVVIISNDIYNYFSHYLYFSKSYYSKLVNSFICKQTKLKTGILTTLYCTVFETRNKKIILSTMCIFIPCVIHTH